MRVFYCAGIAVIALLVGLIAVGFAETVVNRIAIDDVPVVVDNGFDRDAFNAGNSLTTPIDVSVRGVRLGLTMSQVKRILGKPVRVERDADEDSVLNYDGLSIRFTSRDGTPKTADLIEINSTGTSFEGLTIGSTLDEVRSRLGREVYSDENSLTYSTTLDEPINFEHDGKRVTRITAGYEDNC